MAAPSDAEHAERADDLSDAVDEVLTDMMDMQAQRDLAEARMKDALELVELMAREIARLTEGVWQLGKGTYTPTLLGVGLGSMVHDFRGWMRRTAAMRTAPARF